MKNRYAPMLSLAESMEKYNQDAENRTKNKYAGVCACGASVPAMAGKIVQKMHGRGFDVYCLKCHGHEVTRRGDMAMESACGI